MCGNSIGSQSGRHLRSGAGLRLLPYLTVAALGTAIYLQTTSFGFVFDDRWLVAENEFLREPWSALRAFTRHFWQDTPFGSGYYRPLVTASFALNGRLFGWGATGFHAVNVLVHALNSSLLLLLARRLGLGGFAAGVAAALFAVHPAAAWAVGSIVARVDLLPVTFLLLAWIAWARPGPERPVASALPRAPAAGGGWAWTSPLLTGLCFLGALLCKESSVGFLAVLLLAALRPTHFVPGAGNARRAALCCGIALAIALAARWINGIGVPVADAQINPLAALPPFSRTLAALGLSGRYLSFLVFPFGFEDPNDYSRLAPPPRPTVEVIATALVFVAWATAIVLLWWRRDRLALPLAFALATFLPASNLLVPITSLYAENFMYQPLVGFSLAIGELIDRTLAARSARSGEIAAGRARWLPPRCWIAAALMLVLGLRSARDVEIWRDMESLFRAWTQRFPNYALAHGHLGLALLDGGDSRAALAPLRRGLEIDPRSAVIHSNLAVALMRGARSRADLVEALEHCRAALRLDPGFVNARINAAQIRELLEGAKADDAWAAPPEP